MLKIFPFPSSLNNFLRVMQRLGYYIRCASGIYTEDPPVPQTSSLVAHPLTVRAHAARVRQQEATSVSDHKYSFLYLINTH